MAIASIKSLLIASSNAGKLKEFQRIFAAHDIAVQSQSELGITDAIEDGLSFIENAIKKARHASAASGLPALADDSGLDVPVLNGAPGIYSARYAGENATDAQNNAKLIDAMAAFEGEQRRACFRCVLVLLRHSEDPTPLICQGNWWGEILQEPRGKDGFGYDPLFFVPNSGCSSAELEPDHKNQISHRGMALQQLIEQLPTL